VTQGSDRSFPWTELEIAPTRDEAEIKRAYARRLRSVDRTDATAFQRLRRAYEVALGYGANGEEEEEGEGEGEPEPELKAAPRPLSLAPIVREFMALGRANQIAEAIGAVARFIHGNALPSSRLAELQALLCGAVLDAEEQPPALLVALARYFRWNEVGNLLEHYRPDLLGRYLDRQGEAQAWLAHMRTIVQRHTLEAHTAQWLFRRYSDAFARQAIRGVDRLALAAMVREADRFAPYLGDVLDPRMLDLLARRLKDPVGIVEGKPKKARKILFIWLALVIVGVVARNSLDLEHHSYPPSFVPKISPVAVDRWVEFSLLDHRLYAFLPALREMRRDIAEIRYGVDTTPPNQHVESVPPYLELPVETRFVTMQLRYKDGTTSPLYRFDVPANLH